MYGGIVGFLSFDDSWLMALRFGNQRRRGFACWVSWGVLFAAKGEEGVGFQNSKDDEENMPEEFCSFWCPCLTEFWRGLKGFIFCHGK